MQLIVTHDMNDHWLKIICINPPLYRVSHKTSGWVLADKMSKHQMQTVLWDTLYVWLTLVPDVPAEFTPSHPGLVRCWPGNTNADWKTTRNITQYNNNTAQTAAAALQTPDLCAILTALPNSFYNHLQIAS